MKRTKHMLWTISHECNTWSSGGEHNKIGCHFSDHGNLLIRWLKIWNKTSHSIILILNFYDNLDKYLKKRTIHPIKFHIESWYCFTKYWKLNSRNFIADSHSSPFLPFLSKIKEKKYLNKIGINSVHHHTKTRIPDEEQQM